MNYDIIQSTKGLSRGEWLRARQQGIGGSDAAAVTGNSRYSSPLKVFIDKTTPIDENTPDVQNEAMRQGHDLEDYCASRFEEATGKQVRRVNFIVRNPMYPFIIANIDRRVDNEDAILECKTTNAFNGKDYMEGKVPVAYEIQCYHYLLATGAQKCYLAILILGTGFIYHTFERDEEILAALLERETAFWNNHVLANTPPDWDGSEAATEILKDRYSGVNRSEEKELPSAMLADLQRYCEMGRIKKELEQNMELIKQRALDALGEAEIGTVNGEQVAKRIWVNGRESIDSARLRAEKPEIYQEYAKTGNGYARLKVKGEKE